MYWPIEKKGKKTSKESVLLAFLDDEDDDDISHKATSKGVSCRSINKHLDIKQKP